MKKTILSILALFVCSICSLQAQTYPPKDTDTPQLEFALQLRVTLGETYSQA